METNNNEIRYITIYSSYTEAQKKAITKYRTNNRTKVNDLQKKYYDEKKVNDPDFMENNRKRAKEYYQRKKLQKYNNII